MKNPLTINMNFFSEAWPLPLVVVVITVTLILITSVLLSNKKQKHAPPLPPGPKGLPLLGNLLSHDPDLLTHFTNLAQSYGPIYTLKLGLKTCVVATSPALAKQILKEQDATFANRDASAASGEATYGGNDLATASYGPQWRMLRKVCVRELLSNANLDSVYDLRRRELRRTIRCLYEKSGSSPVDFGEAIFSMTFNVMTSMLWGRTLKGEDERISVGAEFKQVITGITRLLSLPNVSDFYPWLERLDVQGIQKKMRGLSRKLDNIFESVIDQKVNTTEKGDHCDKKDFVQVLLKKMEENGDDKNTSPFTMNHLKALLVNMVVGGTETTSNTIEFALAELMNNPEVLGKALHELDQVVGKDRKVEESDIHKLPYLSAVMKEVLRLHPITPLLVPHRPSADCNVGGYTIPRGSCVFINAWAIHRDPTVWENPSKFLPQRFIDAKWDYSGNDFRYIPFSSGRRMCVGTAMAERTFMYSMASLLHSFHWNLPAGEETLDVSEEFALIMKMKKPLVVMATPRLSDPTLYD